MTIHKLQDETMGKIVIYLGENETSPGITFVALSRSQQFK